MSAETLNAFSAKYKTLLEEHMRQAIGNLHAPERLKESMLYSIEAGGKRIRPLLLFATLEAFGKEPAIGMEAASAIEMVHTYSLIHDDLPSMDNDDFRRGKATNHKVFGEAAAILAGDALLTLSFKQLASIPEDIAAPDIKLSLISELSEAAGAEGMVGGQVADMEGETKSLSIKELEYVHTHKTGKLLVYSVGAGAGLAGADPALKKQLEEYAYHIGLAFQIRDDILDLEGDPDKIGKPVGSDVKNDKSTYPSLLTLDGAKQALDHHIHTAKSILKDTGLETGMLAQITDMIALRTS